MNGNDQDGRLTDASDAVANILHWVYLTADEDLDAMEAINESVLERACRNFKAEVTGKED
jgi:hypothetical protein